MKLTGPLPSNAITYRVATTSPLTVRLDGQSAQLRASTLTSYTPVVDDPVAVITLDGSKLLVLGKRT